MAPDSSVNPQTPEKDVLILSKQPILRQKQLEAYGLLVHKTKATRLEDENGVYKSDPILAWNSLSLKARNNPKLLATIIRGHQNYDPHYKLEIDINGLNMRVQTALSLADIKLGDQSDTSLLSFIGRFHKWVVNTATYDRHSIINVLIEGKVPDWNDTEGRSDVDIGVKVDKNDAVFYKRIVDKYNDCVTVGRWFNRCHRRREMVKTNARENAQPATLQERFSRTISNIASVRPHRWVNSLNSTQLSMANRLRPNGECLGIELEFIADAGSSITNWEESQFPVYPWLYFKGDGSIRPNGSDEQLAHFQELTWFINGSSKSDWTNMEAVLKKMVANGAGINNTCGNHVHLDMRHRSQQSAMRTATKVRDAINAWAHRAVSYNRSHNHYCGIGREHQGNRYTAVNTQCYSEHQTIEIRLGMPTLNYYKLKYWCRFMQYLASPYNSVATLEDFMQSDASVDLKHYVFKRILKFQSTYTNNGIQALPNFDSYAIALNQLEGGVE